MFNLLKGRKKETRKERRRNLSKLKDLTNNLKEPNEEISIQFQLLKRLLDMLPLFVYVCDYKTRQIKYANKPFLEEARKIGKFGSETETILDKPCFTILHGSKSICSFCRNEQTSSQDPLIWQCYSETFGKCFIVSQLFVKDWPGCPDGVIFKALLDQSKMLATVKEYSRKQEAMIRLADEDTGFFFIVISIDTYGILDYSKNLSKFFSLTKKNKKIQDILVPIPEQKQEFNEFLEKVKTNVITEFKGNFLCKQRQKISLHIVAEQSSIQKGEATVLMAVRKIKEDVHS
jgi:hypothetical protein